MSATKATAFSTSTASTAAGLKYSSGSTYFVYKIKKMGEGSNAFTTERSECWAIVLDSDFTSEEAAKNYVREANIMHSPLGSRYLVGKNNARNAEREFIDRFCFGPDFLHERVYFLGRPDVKAISRKLAEVGVEVKK